MTAMAVVATFGATPRCGTLIDSNSAAEGVVFALQACELRTQTVHFSDCGVVAPMQIFPIAPITLTIPPQTDDYNLTTPVSAEGAFKLLFAAGEVSLPAGKSALAFVELLLLHLQVSLPTLKTLLPALKTPATLAHLTDQILR